MRRHVIPCLLITGLVVGCGHPRAPQAIHETSSYPARPEKLVRVDVGSVDVEARVAEGDHIGVEVELEVQGSTAAAGRTWLERHRPEVEDTEKTLHIRTSTRRPGLYLATFRETRSVVRVSVPPSCRLEVATTSGDVLLAGATAMAGTVRITTTSGDIRVDGGVATLSVRTASGDCRVAGPPLQSLDFEGASGELRLLAGAARVMVEATSGDVTADELTGAASVNTSSGEVRATWSRLGPGEKIVIAAESGDVDVRLPEGVALRGKLASDSGRIRCDFEGTEGRRAFQLGGAEGASQVTVTTESGDIRLRSTSPGKDERPDDATEAAPTPQAVPAPPEAPVVPRPPVERTPGAV